MSRSPEAAIRVRVDCANPGQFFACCGLLEIADRLWPGTEGWFDEGHFMLHSTRAAVLSELLSAFKTCQMLDQDHGATPGDGDDADADEDTGTSPIELAFSPPLRLDWWMDKSLKPWAGSMNGTMIFLAMRDAIEVLCPDPLNFSCVVHDPAPNDAPESPNGREPKLKMGKKREPFYFDARRGASARSVDIGFAPDALKLETTAFPAVEALCLVGLQRFRPMPANRPRLFNYYTWETRLEARLAQVAACGLLPHAGGKGYRFENAFRTDQRKHKAYGPATPFERSAP